MTRQLARPATHQEIVSYQKLRTFIGLTGILLPILVVLGCWITNAGSASFQISISHFYYSKMHIVFVGVLCVLGGFLVTYRGKDPRESRLSNIAGVCAFGIAACPTTFEEFHFNDNGQNQYLQLCKAISHSWGSLHFAFAGALFFCFVIFCLKYFQRPDADYTDNPEEEKKFQRRKRIYKFCGWTIIFSIAMIALFNFVLEPEKGFFIYSTFIFETSSLWAFGSAWLVKGSVIWKNVPVANKLIKPFR